MWLLGFRSGAGKYASGATTQLEAGKYRPVAMLSQERAMSRGPAIWATAIAVGLVNIGLEDDVCPPETGYAVYNAMTCPKDLHTYPRCAHDAGSYWHATKVDAFLAEHLRPGRSR